MSPPVSPAVRELLEQVPVGVLGTQRPDGTARQSVVYFVVDGDRLVISTESKRAKARDVARTGWASLCVVGSAKPYPSITVEGQARVVRTDIGEPTARIMSRITGSPSDPISDADLAAVDRVILELDLGHVYGASYLRDPSPPAAAP